MGCADAEAQSHLLPFLVVLKTLVASGRRHNQSSPPFVPSVPFPVQQAAVPRVRMGVEVAEVAEVAEVVEVAEVTPRMGFAEVPRFSSPGLK